METANPIWLPLLQRPCEGLLGPKNVWVLRTADGATVHIERGRQGLNNNLYRVRFGGEVFACKLFVVDERARARREWIALCSLHHAGLRLAPEPVAYAPDGPLPHPAIVYRWVNGQPLAGQPLSADDLAALIGSLNQIHQVVPAPASKPLVAWHQPANYAAYLAEIRSFAAQVWSWVEGEVSAARDLPAWVSDLPSLLPLIEETVRMAEAVVAGAGHRGESPVEALIRVDGNLDNVIRDGQGQLVFLDWEYSGWGDPAYDLAELRWHPRAQVVSQAAWQAALETYVPHPDDVTFWKRMTVYHQLLPIWWIGRSALHLLEGAEQIAGRQRLASVPNRMYRRVRQQLDNYLAALGLIEPPEPEEPPEL